MNEREFVLIASVLIQNLKGKSANPRGNDACVLGVPQSIRQQPCERRQEQESAHHRGQL